MISTASQHVASQLDAHHHPETNGRIAVCHRCGCRTDSVGGGHHVVGEGSVTRSSAWLVADARLASIEQARIMRSR
jgi:hypothetical protein